MTDTPTPHTYSETLEHRVGDRREVVGCRAIHHCGEYEAMRVALRDLRNAGVLVAHTNDLDSVKAVKARAMELTR